MLGTTKMPDKCNGKRPEFAASWRTTSRVFKCKICKVFGLMDVAEKKSNLVGKICADITTGIIF